MGHLAIDDERAAARSRLSALRLCALTLRLRANWTELFGDADAAAIALAIASINAEQLLRQKLPSELENLSVPLPDELYRRCNVASIATASGLNRETARRKILRLEQSGFIIREGSEIRLTPGFTQQARVLEMVRLQLDELRKTADELLRDGVFVHQSKENAVSGRQ